MKKKAGTFFKSVFSKGKNLFKTENSQQDENKEQNDFGTEEDQDIIEIGKQQLSKLPEQFLSNLSDFAGQTLQSADQFLHGSNHKLSSNSKESKSDISIICKALSQRQDTEEEEQETLNTENNWLFQDYSDTNFDQLPSKSRLLQQEIERTSDQRQQNKIIDFIVVVGFHHTVGSQVEFIYPPLKEDIQENLSSDFLKQLPRLALPDGSHLTEVKSYQLQPSLFQVGYVNFILNDRKNLYHCISCYRQISSKELPQEDSISRAFVQKAVVVLTKIPLYGEIRAKLYPTTQAFFAQKNFKDTKILEDLYHNANNFGKNPVKDISQYFTGINIKPLLLLNNFNVFTILKLLLLEQRIIVYSSISSKTSNFIYSLLALFPGNILFRFSNSDTILTYLRAIKAYGFPLQLFSQRNLFIPLCTLHELDLLEKCKGYLVGTTNQLLLNFPKAKADMIINLDTDKIEFPNEKSLVVRICRQHTNYEKKMLGKILSQINVELNDERKEPKIVFQNGILRNLDSNEDSELFDLNETEQNFIRQEFKQYFQTLCIQLALTKKAEEDFTTAISPLSKRLNQEQQSNSDSQESDNEEEQIILGEQSQFNESQNHQKDQIEELKQQEEQRFSPNIKLNKQSKKEKQDKVQKFNDKIKQIKEVDKSNVTKMSKLKKRAVKSILGFQGMFNIKFIQAWAQTQNFKHWLKTFDSQIAYLSVQSEFCNNITIYYENGDFYNGNLMNSQKSGVGIYYESISGLTYNGEWWQDQKHGNGNQSSLNQDYVYDGQWESGMKQGQGQLITKQVKYSGGWYKDKYHKFGVLVSNDGSIYEGDWFQGMKQGMGQLKLQNGDIYIGEFQQDQYHGKGQLRLGANGQQSGELYNGEFQQGKRSGQGQYISADQKYQYEGNWFNDKKHGQGVLILINNKQQQEIHGEWYDDQLLIDREVRIINKNEDKEVKTYIGKVDKNYNPII